MTRTRTQNFNVKFSETTHQVLGELSSQMEMPMADVLRESLSILWFIVREYRNGSKLYIKRGNETSELILPYLERLKVATVAPDRDGAAHA